MPSAIAPSVAERSRPGGPARPRQQDAAVTAPPEGRRIYLRADKSLDYGRVMRVMGELNRAGLNRVALVSVGEEQR